MNRKIFKLAIVLLVIVIALIAFVPPQADFMPEEKRFPYVTFPLLPPLLAIALAMATGEIIPALFAGVWVGALMIAGYNPVGGTIQLIDWYIENATDSWNAAILLYDFVLGAFMGLLYTSGAVHSAARAISSRIRSARGASTAASLLGVAVFFDDYGNTVIVGNSMRPVSDKLRVSRELLSYIVDSTAAPVAGIALVSSWIGYEVGLIRDSIVTLSEEAKAGLISVAPEYEAYYMWLNAVPYHFYSILAIIMVFLVVLTRRHYGPMLQAEWRAVREGKVVRDGATPLLPTEEVLGAEPTSKKQASGWLFAIAMIVLVLVTLLGLWATGAEELSRFWETPFTDALMNADTAKALFWAGMATYFVTFAWVLLGRLMSFSEVMKQTVRGMYLMVLPNTILLHAWCIKSATDAVGTAEYVIHGAVVAGLSVFLVPLIIYLASMFISFTTGTSWGTFGVMMPIAVPMAWKLALIQYPDNLGIAYLMAFASIGAVFGGGIFGDHCSPISDTTIMSSMFSASDHIDHVSTQLPYALTAGFVGIILYALLAAGITSPLVLLPAGIILLVVLHRVLNIIYSRRVKLPPVVPNYP
ncbi:MAG: Na+/H+ antiporter NhaC family protein [Desulfurococcaceae archaeon]|jgi:NhaC family Na+:H+ antiporter|nr:Na+/H+ antiporter NhaC family protein [Desulfurococcaceae archaeon]